MTSIPIGSLVRDVDQGDVGLIVGPPRVLREHPSVTQLVLWPSNSGEAMPMDLSAITSGWVEVLSETG